MAESTTITINNIAEFKTKALHWAEKFNVVCLLDSNNYNSNKYYTQDWVLAIDTLDSVEVNTNQSSKKSFDALKNFHHTNATDIFGFLNYDLKNEIENLSSNNSDDIQFPLLYFFKPRYIFSLKGNRLTLNRNYPETFEILESINSVFISSNNIENNSESNHGLVSATSKEEYLKNVTSIKQQIVEGDFYELNYCCEFSKKGTLTNTVSLFHKLNEKLKAPFSTYFKLHDKYLLCASPERFLKKEGRKLISQPIKGTIKKVDSKIENELLKKQLQSDEKEQAENVMIVDLVRNDLARSSVSGTVRVEELFGVYEFETVNHMISTVTSEIRDDIHFVDAIKNTFPMGSMTGAPKVIVMETIERYEKTKRGIFSGSVGYITASGDFDFNVVIRSIMYNSTTNSISVQAGGAITYDSVPEKEYEELLLKAEGMFSVL
jgi:para-aminobenzoate synthetase component 1